MLKKRWRERKREKKKVTKVIYKKNRYKIDNKYQKAKIKNLEQSLESQKYNVKEKKRKKKKKVTKFIKNIYMKFAFFFLKKKGFFFFKFYFIFKLYSTVYNIQDMEAT